MKDLSWSTYPLSTQTSLSGKEIEPEPEPETPAEGSIPLKISLSIPIRCKVFHNGNWETGLFTHRTYKIPLDKGTWYERLVIKLDKSGEDISITNTELLEPEIAKMKDKLLEYNQEIALKFLEKL